MNHIPSQDPALYQGGNMGDLLIDAIQRGGDRVAFVHGEHQRVRQRRRGCEQQRHTPAQKSRFHLGSSQRATRRRPEFPRF